MNEFTGLHVFFQFKSFGACAFESFLLFFLFATSDLETSVRTACIIFLVARVNLLTSLGIGVQLVTFLTFANGFRFLPP